MNRKKLMSFLFMRKVIKQTLENYRAVSLLPICSKVFERLICKYSSFLLKAN